MTVSGREHDETTEKWVLSKLNEIGAEGKRPLVYTLSFIPGRTLLNGQQIPSIMLDVIVETEIPSSTKKASPV
jgi:hypothetical protein